MYFVKVSRCSSSKRSALSPTSTSTPDSDSGISYPQSQRLSLKHVMTHSFIKTQICHKSCTDTSMVERRTRSSKCFPLLHLIWLTAITCRILDTEIFPVPLGRVIRQSLDRFRPRACLPSDVSLCHNSSCSQGICPK